MSKHHPPQSLDYLRSSPVRGQLEPHDPKTTKGWRYIQTTDTLDELKVLLPPATASMYEQLLKFENYELSKKSAVPWERILEIRHLKDRMIRKCQKLSKDISPIIKNLPRGETFGFQTFIAPSDFRVKEMEKWFREQQKRPVTLSRRPSAPVYSTTATLGSAYCSGHCAAAGFSCPRHSQHPSAHQIHRSATTSGALGKQRSSPHVKSMAAHQSRLIQPEKIAPSSGNKPLVASLTPATALIGSPPPLPVLLLGHREEYGLDPPLIRTVESPPSEPFNSWTEEQDSPPDPSPESSSTRQLRHRRSCIKRASIGDLVKTVSWADNQELDRQVSKYASAARSAQASGKWDEVRTLYLEQIMSLENLHIQVKDGLEHLRSETDHLQRIDESIRRQREALDATFQELEQKHTQFEEKVQEALMEADYALNASGVRKPELPVINEA